MADLLKHLWVIIVVLAIGGTSYLIRTMRARAPDSLRTVFAADSLTYEGPREAAADSATTTAPGPQEGHPEP